MARNQKTKKGFGEKRDWVGGYSAVVEINGESSNAVLPMLIRFSPYKKNDILGSLSINIAGIIIEGVWLHVNSTGEWWLAMPSRKVNDEYRNYVYFMNKDLQEFILSKLDEELHADE